MNAELVLQLALAAAPGLVAAGGLFVRLRAVEKKAEATEKQSADNDKRLALVEQTTERLERAFDAHRNEMRELMHGVGNRLEEKIELAILRRSDE